MKNFLTNGMHILEVASFLFMLLNCTKIFVQTICDIDSKYSNDCLFSKFGG